MKLLTVDVDRITSHPRNVRTDLGDLTELTASVRAQGLLQPVVLAPAPDDAGEHDHDGTYWLIAGHRRLAAAKAAGITSLPAVVREDLTTTAAQLEAMLVENLQRADLTAVEEGDAYQALLEYPDYDVKAIATKTGRAVKTIRERVTLAASPDAIRQRLTTGQVTIEHALAVAEFADDADVHARLVKALGSPNFGWELQRAKEERAHAKQRAALLKEAKKAGVDVIDVDSLPADAEWADLDEIRAVRAQVLAVLGDAATGSSWLSKEWQDTAASVHAPCPGHAARVENVYSADGGWTWKLIQLCTQPHLHDTGTSETPGEYEDAGESDAQRQDREAREAEQQLQADLATAAEVRRAFVELLADATRARAWFRFDSHTSSWWLLGLPHGVSDADLAAAVGTTPAATLLRVLAVQSLANSDFGLAHTWGWRDRPNASRTSWLKLLEELGYQWSDVEQRMFVEADAARQAEDAR